MMYPVGPRERERLRHLHGLHILDAPPDTSLEAVCRTAQRLFSVPIVLIPLLDEKHAWFRARCGLEASCAPREVAFCNYTVMSNDLVVIDDTTADPRSAENPLVTGDLGIRFYAGAPLSLDGSAPVGTFCLLDTKPRLFAEHEREALRDLAEVVVSHLRLHRARIEAADEAEVRRTNEALIERQKEELSRHAAELEHRKTILDATLQNMDQGLMMIDAEGIVRVHNNRLAELLEFPLEILSAQPSFETLRSIQAANGEYAKTASELRGKFELPGLRLGDPCYERERPNGTVLEVRTVPLPDGGAVRTFTDITARMQAERALRLSQERYRLAAKATRDAIWDWDLVSDEATWGEALRDVLGYREELTRDATAWWMDKIHPDDREAANAVVQSALEAGEDRWEVEYRMRRADGGYVSVLDRAFVLRDGQGQPVRMVGALQDLTDRRAAETARAESEKQLRRLLDTLPAAIYTTDAEGRITYFNDAAAQIWGREPQPGELWTGAWRLHAPDGSLMSLGEGPMAKALRTKAAVRDMEAVIERPDGSKVPVIPHPTPIVDDAGEMVGAVNLVVDITARKAAEQEIRRRAYSDALTGLPNRASFQLELEGAIRAAEQERQGLALLLLDLDAFKDVNDTLGHEAGDRLLQEIASRLMTFEDQRTAFARLGGDEFAVVLSAIERPEDALRVADAILAALRMPFVHAGRKFEVRASIGIALFPEHDTEFAELMRDADIALYQAKAQGRNRAVLYNASARAALEGRLSLLTETRAALERDEFVPYYQPKVCLRSGAVIGFEALARWRHPEGLRTPAHFSVAFEDLDASVALGRSLSRQIIGDVAAWTMRGIGFGQVAINFSSVEFNEPELANEFVAAISEAQVYREHSR